MSDYPIVVSSCDLYKDAWNPFFRLLQINWENCPKKVYLITETENYSDPYFDVTVLHHNSPIWSNRVINTIKNIESEYFWFFLEDFFLEERVNTEIIDSAIHCIETEKNVGVIKFIPNIAPNWYNNSESCWKGYKYFSQIPKESKARSNLMLALYNKDYFCKLLRKNESPWDFEKFGTYRTRRYPEEILIQNDLFPLAFPYNYQIKYGFGISAKKWLRNNKKLFERYNIEVNFENLGWYTGNEKVKIIGLKRSKKEKLLMPFKESKTFYKIISTILKDKIYCITHIRHYF